jgi:hypothetical protein
MLKVSHIQWRVPEIKRAVSLLKDIGFQVDWARDPRIAMNAFIWFETGPFIELMEAKTPMSILSVPLSLFYGRSMGKRWMKWYESTPGLCDFALEAIDEEISKPENIERVRRFIEAQGIKTSKAIFGKRKPPTGEKVTFAFFAPESASLPFVVSAYSIPQKPKQIFHTNGTKSIMRFTYSSTDDDIRCLKALLSKDNSVEILFRRDTVCCLSSLTLNGIDNAYCSEALFGVQFENGLSDSHGEV